MLLLFCPLRHTRVPHPLLRSSFFPFELRSKGWDYNYRLCSGDCTVFTELVTRREDHRIPPFAKTKTAKDGAPFCVVAQAKGGPPAQEGKIALARGRRKPGAPPMLLLFCPLRHTRVPILCRKARSFFLSFAAKGGIIITAYAQKIALISRSW